MSTTLFEAIALLCSKLTATSAPARAVSNKRRPVTDAPTPSHHQHQIPLALSLLAAIAPLLLHSASNRIQKAMKLFWKVIQQWMQTIQNNHKNAK